jgi:hypothetical protein
MTGLFILYSLASGSSFQGIKPLEVATLNIDKDLPGGNLWSQVELSRWLMNEANRMKGKNRLLATGKSTG